MEFTTETVEVEEICDDQSPAKKLKKVVVKDYVSEWKADSDYKSWVEKSSKKDDEIAATYSYATTDGTETVELDPNDQKRHQLIEIKSVKKANTPNTSGAVKNNRSTKRQIKVLDPNLPAFVCTEHNENISLDCRYCRIASGYKKKSSQKYVQNNEISSSGKVTVAIPKANPAIIQAKAGVSSVECL